MPVRSFPIYLLTYDECVEAAVRICKAIAPSAEKSASPQRLLSMTEELVSEFNNVLGISRSNPLTAVLAEKDSARDSILGNFIKYIRGAQSHHEEEKAQAAAKLYRLIKQYRFDIKSGSYAAESTRIRSLLTELEQDEELKAAVELIGVGQVVIDLRRAQMEFETAHEELLASKAQISAASTLGRIVKPLRKDIRHLLNLIDAFHAMYPDEWNDTVNELDEIVVELASRAKGRRTRGENEKEEEEEPNGENGENNEEQDMANVTALPQTQAESGSDHGK